MTMSTREEGETDLVVTRRFKAPPERIFLAHVEPDLIRRWMNVGDDWTMDIVSCDARPGGDFRYDYANGEMSFSIQGTFLELEPPRRILHEETMVMDPPCGPSRVETLLEPDGTGTRMVMTISYPDAEARARMLGMGMTEGMASTYDALDALEPD